MMLPLWRRSTKYTRSKISVYSYSFLYVLSSRRCACGAGMTSTGQPARGQKWLFRCLSLCCVCRLWSMLVPNAKRIETTAIL